MKLIRQSALITSIIGLIQFIACKDIGGIERDTPPIPSGNQYIQLNLSTLNGEDLPTYTVDVTAPDGSTSTGTSDSIAFLIGSITSGTYTIAISSSAYVGQTKEISVNVPSNSSDDYITGADFILTMKNGAFVVSNEDGVENHTIPSMGTGLSGLGSSSISITIPPGAIEGTGTTTIYVTAAPSEGGTTTNGLKGVTIDFEPDGLTFTTPITLDMPLDYPQSFVSNGIELYFEHESSGDVESIDLTTDGSTGTVSISHFSQWTIICGLDYVITNSTRSQTFTSDCGEGLDESFTFSGSYGPIVTNLLQIPSSTVTISGTVEKESISYFTLTGRATAYTISYELATPSGNVLEQRNNIPLCSSCYTTTYTSTACHDSGG